MLSATCEGCGLEIEWLGSAHVWACQSDIGWWSVCTTYHDGDTEIKVPHIPSL